MKIKIIVIELLCKILFTYFQVFQNIFTICTILKLQISCFSLILMISSSSLIDKTWDRHKCALSSQLYVLIV